MKYFCFYLDGEPEEEDDETSASKISRVFGGWEGQRVISYEEVILRITLVEVELSIISDR